jgi:hypothetical protein
LRALAKRGLIALYYFDGAGFTTPPCVPYAWGPVGGPRELPCFPSRRLNVLGFLSSQGESGRFFPVEGKVTAAEVIAAFDAFTLAYESGYLKYGTPCVVVLDNASYHTCAAVKERQGLWASRGVVLHFLPPYSPELNRIETLWRRIKYDWLPLPCLASYDLLKQTVLDVLAGVGSIYHVNFV